MSWETGAGIVAGSVLGGLFGRSNAKSSYAFQREFAQNRRQWEVEDLKAAGLNPILAAGGSGASAPSAAMPITPDFASAFSSAAKVGPEIEQIKATVTNLMQDTETKHAESWLKDAQRTLAEFSSSEKLIAMDLMQEELKIRKRMGNIAESDYGKIMAWIRETTQSISGSPIRGSVSVHR